MKEFPDDELDKLFRKSAEELDSNFDPEDWNALKNRLDENDGRTPAAWFKKWWPVGMLALLMLAGLTTYLLTNKEGDVDNRIVNKEKEVPGYEILSEGRDKQISEKNNIPVEEPAEEKNIREKSGDDNSDIRSGNDLSENNGAEPKTDISSVEKLRITKTINPAEITVTDKPGDSGNKALLSTKNKVSKAETRKTLPRRWSKTGGVYLAPNHSIGRRGDGASLSKRNNDENGANFIKTDIEKTKSERLNSGIENINGSGINENTGKNSDITGSSGGNVEKENISIAFNRLNIDASELKSRPFIGKRKNSLPKIEVKGADILPVSEPVKAVSEKEPSPKFAVRFGYSPDISSVGLKNFTKPGSAVSLLAEYAILPKLYIQSGVTRSSKVYKAGEGDYEWPSSWNDQTVRPYSTDGACKVIEIPLNLRYDISSNTRSRWFAGAGVSSYHMQNEKYVYNYEPNTVGIKWPGWHGSTGWYWLSHINASVGYEYRFSKKLSLLAEPYVRIPVKKVGFGKVDLFTTGIWFSIRYTPIFKK